VSATLRPFIPDPGKVLAFVDADDLDWLYEALARYGITLHDQLVHSSLEVKDSDPPPNYPTA
jgi:hypothetical protein